ncbi:unnamed protein product [Echinostoma caproni]|uniref:LTD domain-containing protein n=1 Tax=Echinostoma caproni TaxID=27848 RepID=A0A183BF73_9TREM|nr:unnamed protein product [Echinostoma caproni]
MPPSPQGAVFSAGDDTVGWLQAVDVYNSGPSGRLADDRRYVTSEPASSMVYGPFHGRWNFSGTPGVGTGSDSQTLSPGSNMRMD